MFGASLMETLKTSGHNIIQRERQQVGGRVPPRLLIVSISDKFRFLHPKEMEKNLDKILVAKRIKSNSRSSFSW